MSATTVQTSAQHAEPDMFADRAGEAHAFEDAMFELHGTMASPAEVRFKPVGDGTHVRPVLCLEVRPRHTGLGRSLHAEQVYPEDGLEAAHAKAAALKKGVPITLLTSLRDMRTILPHVQAVTLHSAH